MYERVTSGNIYFEDSRIELFLKSHFKYACDCLFLESFKCLKISIIFSKKILKIGGILRSLKYTRLISFIFWWTYLISIF